MPPYFEVATVRLRFIVHAVVYLSFFLNPPCFFTMLVNHVTFVQCVSASLLCRAMCFLDTEAMSGRENITRERVFGSRLLPDFLLVFCYPW